MSESIKSGGPDADRSAAGDLDKAAITRPIAAFAAGLDLQQVPEDVRTFARHCLLDFFAVTLAGCHDQTGLIVLEEARERGSSPQAGLIGHAGRFSALDAALINGTFSHALDYDDVNFNMPGHPTVAVAPAALALAQRLGKGGKALLAAFIAGVETECRVGRYVTREQYLRGFHATGTVGTFGAAAACAHLHGMDAERTATSLGIAAAQAAGLKSLFGTMCKPLHAGKAAANGVYAADLAARGFTSRADVLECEQGFADTHTPERNPAMALEGLGTRWLTPATLFKFHAACYGTHASIEAAAKLRRERGVTPERIKRIDVHVPRGNLRMCNIEQPRTGLEAKFSLRHTTAMALADVSTASTDAYNEQSCLDPTLTALREKTWVVGADELGEAISDVMITLDDGVVFRERGDMSVPYTDMALQESRLKDKFIALVEPVLGQQRCDELAERLLGIESEQDLHALTELSQLRKD
ncbi:MAG: MmgE/PrpD family protein [Gammaproteobacteria bacterium]|nr:MmgE/PrpD family protein [Gammaproteobacteria bacterium]